MLTYFIFLACGVGIFLRRSKRWNTYRKSLDQKRIQNAVLLIAIFWIVYYFSNGLQSRLYAWLVQLASLGKEAVGSYVEASPLILFLGETFVNPCGILMMIAICLGCAILPLSKKYLPQGKAST